MSVSEHIELRGHGPTAHDRAKRGVLAKHMMRTTSVNESIFKMD